MSGDIDLETGKSVGRTPEEFRTEMFRDGGPDVAVCGIDIFRSTIVSTHPDDDEVSELHWHISTIPSDDENDPSPIMLIGDLSITMDGWFVGITVAMMLAFRDGYPLPDLEDLAAVNELGTVLGPWASNGLYDVAAIVARQLVASSLGCSVKVPAATPPAHITRAHRREDTIDET